VKTLTNPSDRRQLRLLLADDSVLVREGIARLVQEEGFDVVGQTGTADELEDMVADLHPDLVVTDVRMPPTFMLEGLRAAIQLRARFPGQAVLVLSQQIQTTYAIDLLGHGARGVGYLLKDRVTSIAIFIDALSRVAAGGTAIDEEVVAALMGRSRRLGGLEVLTSREREVLSLMAEGMSNPAITRRLHLSSRTVESHVGRIFGKLGLLPDLDDERRVLAVIHHLQGG
jgi:DNA-binding NarL/FixJ family response regulator